jgi:hypothetical protein
LTRTAASAHQAHEGTFHLDRGPAAPTDRLSLQERYGTHENYVNLVRAASARIVAEGYLLQADADALIAQAAASGVLKP